MGIADGHHFPFSDDPQAYAAAICTWWTQQVAAAPIASCTFIREVLKESIDMSTSHVLGNGSTALITGASRGIGPLIAREIAKEGGHVVLTGRSAAELQAVTSDLTASGAAVSFVPADLTEPGAAASPGTDHRATAGRDRPAGQQRRR